LYDLLNRSDLDNDKIAGFAEGLALATKYTVSELASKCDG